MRNLGVADLLVLLVFVVLVFDSRRLHALRTPGRRPLIPAGVNPDQVGLSLQHIQMRAYVDWEDGGIGWDGPEILPADEPDEGPVDAAGAEPARVVLPVLWTPFPALPAAGRTGEWAQAEQNAPAERTPGEERTPAFC